MIATLFVAAQSGHHDRAERCPLLGVKRTSGKLAAMSANDPKRTSYVDRHTRAPAVKLYHHVGRGSAYGRDSR